MRRFLIIILVVLLLAGCGAQEAQVTTQTTVPTTTAVPMVDIGGTELMPDVTELNLSVLEYDMATLLQAAQALPAVERIELGCTTLTAAAVKTLQEAFPEADISYTVSLLGLELDPDTTELDLSGTPVVAPQKGSNLALAQAALAELGYGQAEIAAALKGLAVEGMSTEEIIKQGLRAMVMR